MVADRDTKYDGISWWGRPAFLNSLSAATFLTSAFLQYLWWQAHGSPLSWVLLLATPLLAFGPAGVIVKLARKRWTARWANAHQFTYEPQAGWAIPAWDFPPFTMSRGFRFRVRDGMHGSIGACPASFFHLTWLRWNLINVTTHYRNVFVLRLPTALPRLTVGVHLDTTVGGQVEFESADFNDRFFVYCADPAYAHAVFTPQTIEQLVQLNWRQSATTKYEIAGDCLIAVTISGNRPQEISEVFEVMRIISGGIPGFVWTDYGATALDRNPPLSGADSYARNMA